MKLSVTHASLTLSWFSFLFHSLFFSQ